MTRWVEPQSGMTQGASGLDCGCGGCSVVLGMVQQAGASGVLTGVNTRER